MLFFVSFCLGGLLVYGVMFFMFRLKQKRGKELFDKCMVELDKIEAMRHCETKEELDKIYYGN